MQYELLGTKIDKGQWVWGEERALQAIANYERFLEESGGRTLAEYWRDTGESLSFIRKSPDDGKPQYWRAPAERRLGDTVWSGVPIANSDHGFKTAKNEKYLAEVLRLASDEGDWVLDFFGGSGSTLATAHKLHRKWVGVEQLDYIDEITCPRLADVVKGEQLGISKAVGWTGGGEFVYCELAKANQVFIDAIQSANTSEELLAIWKTMQDKAFLSYRINPKAFDESKSDFIELSLADQKKFLIETLDKNMLYVPLSEIDDATYEISEADKALNKKFFA